MTALVPYATGTISVAADGTAVTGAGVNWSGTNVRPGDRLDSGHFSALIVEVVDETHLTITPWPGATLSGAAYNIWPNYPQRVVGAEAMTTVNRLVADLSNRDIPVIVGASETEPDPSLGDDDQYADQPTTGKKWVKVGGVWTFVGIFKAFLPKGAWDSGATYTVNDVVTSGGSSYICILDHTNHAPPNTTYWQLLASKGDPGGTGSTGAGYGGTSATSIAIGAGAKAFTTQAGLAYQNGARVRATATAGVTGWLEGVATYSGTALTITSDKTSGSGTGTAWNFNVVGEPGAGDMSSANRLSELSSAAASSEARRNLGIPGRNYLLNPSGEIDQEVVGGGVSRADAAYDFDQWLTLTQSNPVTVSSVADSENGTPFMMRSLQANASAQRFGRIQWLESRLCKELRGKAVALSARVRMSAATTLRYAIVEWTGTADAITKDVVADWNNGTFTAGNFFTSTSTTIVAAGSIALAANTLTDLTALTGTVSGSMNNLAVLFWTNSTQAQNVTLDVAKVKLEQASAASAFMAPDFAEELRACKRYFRKSYDYATAPGAATKAGLVSCGFNDASGTGAAAISFDVPMRAAPSTINYWDGAGNASKISYLTSNSSTWNDNSTTGVAPFNPSQSGFTASGPSAVGHVQGFLHYTANARL